MLKRDGAEIQIGDKRALNGPVMAVPHFGFSGSEEDVTDFAKGRLGGKAVAWLARHCPRGWRLIERRDPAHPGQPARSATILQLPDAEMATAFVAEFQPDFERRDLARLERQRREEIEGLEADLQAGYYDLGRLDPRLRVRRARDYLRRARQIARMGRRVRDMRAHLHEEAGP